LGVLSPRTRDTAQRFSGRLPAGYSDVTQRENSHKTFIAINDWQSSDLNVTHVAGDLLDILIVEAVFDVLAHHIANPGFCTLCRLLPSIALLVFTSNILDR
jgi:hypothetical protein